MTKRRCSHCGYEILTSEIDRQNFQPVSTNIFAYLFGKMVAIIVIGAIASIAICAGVLLLSNNTEPKPPAKEPVVAVAPKQVPIKNEQVPIRTPKAELKASEEATPEVTKKAVEPITEPAPEPKKELAIDRRAVWTELLIAEHEAEKATIQKFGHRPRPTKDTTKQIVGYRVMLQDETNRRVRLVMDKYNLTKMMVDDLNAEASKESWTRPALTPNADLD